MKPASAAPAPHGADRSARETPGLADDASVVQRLLDHIDRGSTDAAQTCWREPVANYRSPARLDAELKLLRRLPVPFCPSAALPENGAYLARTAAGVGLLAVRGADGQARVFRNACRHRGAQLAEGSGCTKGFVCRYHGWGYGLDGSLRHVPHAEGFPDLEPSTRGLVPVAAFERSGLVFAAQDPDGELQADELPRLIAPEFRLQRTRDDDVQANWKILAEGFIEGYHIRALHKNTFFPAQYDNLNLVERFGRNSRVTYPYQAIEKLRALPAAERKVERALTYLYHLFPNVMIATFPTNVSVVVLEPLTLERTRVLSFVLSRDGAPEPDYATAFIDAGLSEDRAVACSIQQGLASGANEFLEFGRYEGAIGHFHRTLGAALGESPRTPARA